MEFEKVLEGEEWIFKSFEKSRLVSGGCGDRSKPPISRNVKGSTSRRSDYSTMPVSIPSSYDSLGEKDRSDCG